MQHLLTMTLVGLVIGLGAPVGPPTPAQCGGESPSAIDTGDPIPSAPLVCPGCEETSKTVKWLGWRTVTPLAVVDGGGICSAPRECCGPWSVKGTSWEAIGPLGQLLGTVTVEGGEGYDATQCYELVMGPPAIAEKAVAFASTSYGAQAAPTTTWAPSKAELATLEALVDQVESLYVDKKAPGVAFAAGQAEPSPLLDRSLLVKVAGIVTGPKGEAMPTKVAVMGGYLLVVAFQTPEGAWKVGHVDALAAHEGKGPEAIVPLGVFDMDGDGVVEILYHRDFASGWEEVILQRTGTFLWEPVAQSIGGGTV